MYLKIVCLSELNRNHFYLLPLRLLLLPLNKNYFSNIVGFCVYIINTIIHGCLKIWNFSSRVQFEISRVSVANEWDIALNTRGEIPYLRAPMYYCLFFHHSIIQCDLIMMIGLHHKVAYRRVLNWGNKKIQIHLRKITLNVIMKPHARR